MSEVSSNALLDQGHHRSVSRASRSLSLPASLGLCRAAAALLAPVLVCPVTSADADKRHTPHETRTDTEKKREAASSKATQQQPLLPAHRNLALSNRFSHDQKGMRHSKQLKSASSIER